jgi:hypothetical protein
VSWKTIAAWAALAFTVWLAIEHPASASHLVHGIGSFITTAGSGLSHFASTV